MICGEGSATEERSSDRTEREWEHSTKPTSLWGKQIFL